MNEKRITLTNINIRQSIVILLAKLILTDILFAFIVISIDFLLTQTTQVLASIAGNITIVLSFFIILGVLKLLTSSYVVLEWLNEYYEITPEAIIHKKGFIFRENEKYNISMIRRIRVEDTFLGELLNYATISFYDYRLNKFLDLYLIHNPDRYAKIIRALKPDVEMKMDIVRLPFMPKRELRTDFEADID